jgi:hypothetical protein
MFKKNVLRHLLSTLIMEAENLNGFGIKHLRPLKNLYSDFYGPLVLYVLSRALQWYHFQPILNWWQSLLNRWFNYDKKDKRLTSHLHSTLTSGSNSLKNIHDVLHTHDVYSKDFISAWRHYCKYMPGNLSITAYSVHVPRAVNHSYFTMHSIYLR